MTRALLGLSVLVLLEFAAAGMLRQSVQEARQIRILEILAGANGDSRIQFLGVSCPGERQTITMLFYDVLGRETGKFRFPLNSAVQCREQILLATREFARLVGAPGPDVLIPPVLNAHSGRVCLVSSGTPPAERDCVTYGGFAGIPDAAAGPAAPDLPITNTVSLRRTSRTGRNTDFTHITTPAPTTAAGAFFRLPVSSQVLQGQALFESETFAGNGRTCATCHVAEAHFGLPPENVKKRFAELTGPDSSFDPLFIAETAPSAFDAGFDFNLNTLTIETEVSDSLPCTGELRGLIRTSGGSRARILARTGPVTYLVYGGMTPLLSGAVTDGMCTARVLRVLPGDLAARPGAGKPGIEDPARLRNEGLILENIDGLSNPPVFRKSPHLLNLAYSAPYGLSGDFTDLPAFITSAVVQHFPRTLARKTGGPNPDFRLPTPDELAAMEAFLLAQEFPAGSDPNRFDLARFATTESQRKGLEEFSVFGCEVCHGGPALSHTTIATQGKAVGVNASFNTGSAGGAFRGTLPCESPAGPLGPCGSREFSTPQLFNLPKLGPFFHNSSMKTISDAVEFYRTGEFGNSPANLAFISEGIGVVPTDAITAFLEGLVVRPYTLGEGPVRFGAHRLNAGPVPPRSVTITNTSGTPLRFEPAACRLRGSNPAEFSIALCPLAGMLAPGDSRTLQVVFQPTSEGSKSAILEVHPSGEAPAGVDLFGVGGILGPPPQLLSVEATAGPSQGGAFAKLVGVNFADGATVTIGGVPAGFVTVFPTAISVRSGPHAPGRVDVVVVNPDGQVTTLANSYTYTDSAP